MGCKSSSYAADSKSRSSGEQHSFSTHRNQEHPSANALHTGSILNLLTLQTTNRIVTCSDDGTIAVSDAGHVFKANYEPVRLRSHTKAVNRITAVDNDIWSVSRDLCVKQWNADDGVCKQTIVDAHSLNVSAITAQKTNTSTIFTGSRDYSVKGWDVMTGKEFVKFSAPRNIVTTMGCHSSSPNLIYQGAEDLNLRVWDVRQSSSAPSVVISGYVYFALCMDISSDGFTIATGTKGFDSVGCEVKIIDLRNPSKFAKELRGHSQDVSGCRFSELDNKTVISVCKDSSIIAWDITQEGDDAFVSTASASGKNLSSLGMLAPTAAGEDVFAVGSLDGCLMQMSFGHSTAGFKFLESTSEYFEKDNE